MVNFFVSFLVGICIGVCMGALIQHYIEKKNFDNYTRRLDHVLVKKDVDGMVDDLKKAPMRWGPGVKERGPLPLLAYLWGTACGFLVGFIIWGN